MKIPDGTVVRVTDRYAACHCDSHAEPTECATIREMVTHPGEVLQSFRRWWIFGQRMYCVVMDMDVPNPVMYFTADEIVPSTETMHYVY